jgi:hypothetical protein
MPSLAVRPAGILPGGAALAVARRPARNGAPARLAAIAAILLWVTSAPAGAKAGFVMNFDALAQNDTLQQDIGPVDSPGGFTLTATHFSPIANPPSFELFGTQSPFSPGRTALYHHIRLGQITLPRADGGAFDFHSFHSIALAELPGGDALGNPVNSGPFGVTFYGTKREGSSVSDTVTVQGEGGKRSPTHQLNNLDLEALFVPAPSGLVLACLAGCLLFGHHLLTRRRLIP